MPSELRVDLIQNRSGLGTITVADSGTIVSGIVSAVGPITISAVPFYQNVQNVSHDFTVYSNFNAMSIGPIGIDTGIVVGINTGGTWVIV